MAHQRELESSIIMRLQETARITPEASLLVEELKQILQRDFHTLDVLKYLMAAFDLKLLDARMVERLKLLGGAFGDAEVNDALRPLITAAVAKGESAAG